MADSEKYYGNEKKVVDVVGVTEYTSDSESQIVAGNAPHGLKRQLKNRHIAMIRCVIRFIFRGVSNERVFASIGGVIGTGLFLGTATALHNGGPVGLLLGYSAIGSICFAV